MEKLNVDKLNFYRCEDEKIHIPESIQGYGYLFALDQTEGIIKVVSDNVNKLLKKGLDIIGSNFFELLKDREDTDFLRETHSRAKRKQTRLPLRLSFRHEELTAKADGNFLAVVYDSGEYFVVELEPAIEFREEYSARHFIKLYALTVAPKFSEYTGLDQMAKHIVETIQYITNMERVVLYKFSENGSGKVIAEAKVDGMESYLGVNYPAKDIPPQARELYKKNWVRLLPNVDMKPSKLFPAPENGERPALDMTHSLLRDLSPIHRQYVRNQGLKSSMSLSLVTHDNLWGMISCHSREPRYVPQNIRLECENLSQLFSWHLYAKEEELYLQKREALDKVMSDMIDRTNEKKPIVDLFKEDQEGVLNIMEADGFVFYTGKEEVKLGQVPDTSLLKKLFEEKSSPNSQPLVTNSIIEEYGDDSRLNGIKGVLMMPLLEHRKYFTAWFRTEHIHTQKWAGAPEEQDASGSKKDRLTPRTSFEVHERKITEKSKEWDHHDIDVAYRLNKVFMAHTLEKQEKMRESIDSLELESRYKNEFLATLAHELRNPLTPISTGISLLEMDSADNETKQVVDVMKRQVAHMTTMIDDLMDVSRITRGKISLNKEKHSLETIIRRSVETIGDLIAKKEHRLELDLPEEDIFILGDETRLNQVFNNVLDNAAKYTPPRGEISIKVNGSGSRARASISDNGKGIPPDKLNDVFSMFSQVEADSTQTKGGLGIGLTLVKKLVELHDGKIEANSNGLNKGSEFIIEFPLYEREENRDEKISDSNPSFDGSKILLVDDNPDVIGTMELLLKREGMVTQTALSGEEAISVFREFKPEFAIFDIGMPDIDGYELCKRLRDLPEAADTIFFSHSGWANRRHIDRAKEAGFQEHLVKPLSLEKLKEAMNNHRKSQ